VNRRGGCNRFTSVAHAGGRSGKPNEHERLKKRIGIVTSGGDCPGANVVIRTVATAITGRGRATSSNRSGDAGRPAPRQHRPPGMSPQV